MKRILVLLFLFSDTAASGISTVAAQEADVGITKPIQTQNPYPAIVPPQSVFIFRGSI